MMHGVLLEDYSNPKNSRSYEKGQTVSINGVSFSKKYYYIFNENDDSIDWIPEHLVEII